MAKTKNKLNVSETLSRGLAGWLMYEHYSYRADLFSEKYLAHGIGNILNGNPTQKTKAEHDHPVLTPKKSWAGRNPQLDFVQFDEDGKIAKAFESKFLGVGNSKLRPGDVIWDLIRLELVNHELGIDCFFLLAGKKKKIDAFFASKEFLDPRVNGVERPILPSPGNQRRKLVIQACSDNRLKGISKYLKQYKDVSMPADIHIDGYRYFPEECRNFDNQVFIWKVVSMPTTRRFLPSEDKRLFPKGVS